MSNVKIVLIAVALAIAGSAAADVQETRTLTADVSGSATDSAGASQDLTLNLTGDVTVTSSGHGVDRTAFTQGPTATLLVTLGESSFEIPVTVSGEGVSLVQTGVSADAWRLSAQGTSVPGPDTRTAPQTAQFRGSFTLLGSEEGGYLASGEGVLTVQDGRGSTTYQLAYQGDATFE